MNARRVEITLRQEMWDRLEKARGHEPRAAFIKRVIEQALDPTGDEYVDNFKRGVLEKALSNEAGGADEGEPRPEYNSSPRRAASPRTPTGSEPAAKRSVSKTDNPGSSPGSPVAPEDIPGVTRASRLPAVSRTWAR